MKYPNLIAEVKQLDIPSYISRLADSANITEEVLQDILDGTDQPTVAEAVSISEYLGCAFDYLFSRELTVVDVSNKDHRTGTLLLECKLTQLREAGIIGIWDMDRYRRACALPELIRTGEVIPYAELQGSIRYIDWMLRVSRHWRNQPVRRARA